MPKSRTKTLGGVALDSTMLSGLRSRWTTPLACAASSASAIVSRMSSASIERQRTIDEVRAQRASLDEIHHEIEPAVVEPAEREHVDHVLVIDLVHRARFANEALRSFGRRRELVAQHLDRDALADHGMLAGVDLAHRARADEALDDVLADLRARGELLRVRHAARSAESVGLCASGDESAISLIVAARHPACRSVSRRCARRGWQICPPPLADSLAGRPPDSRGIRRVS